MADKPIGSAPRAQQSVSGASVMAERSTALVRALAGSFQEQVRRALGFELDGSTTSLAVVDHYVSLARDEDREPIVSLLAAGAGAYYGELVRERIGGTWVGDGTDPRRLRLLAEPQFVHFSPVDQAYEAIAGTALSDDDPRVAPGPTFDSSFGLRPPSPERPDDDEAAWLHDRLAELSPVPEDQFYSLTCRFETLELMLELLAAKYAGEGRQPRRHGLGDYVDVLTRQAH